MRSRSPAARPSPRELSERSRHDPARDQGARARGRPAHARARRPAQPHVRDAVRPRRHVPPCERARRRLRPRRRGRRELIGYGVREIRRRRGCRPRSSTRGDEAAGGRRQLEGFKDSKRQLIELRKLEDEGDRLNRAAIAELFASGDGRDRDHPLEGHPRAARGGSRRVRERGGRPRGDSRQEPLATRETAPPRRPVVVALGFDFTNGFHDTANAVATSVSTRALSPRLAVLDRVVANLAGAFVTTAVAKTVGKGIIDTGSRPSRRCSRRCSARSRGTCSRGGSACRRARRTR